MKQLLMHPGLTDMEAIGHGEVKLIEVQVPAAWVGQAIADVLDGRVIVFAVTRAGRAFTPKPGDRFREDDLAYLSLPADLLPELIEAALQVA
jgi:Trk K+ transport system NAD-binding subunit